MESRVSPAPPDAIPASISEDVTEGEAGPDVEDVKPSEDSTDATPSSRLVLAPAVDTSLPPITVIVTFETGAKKPFVVPAAAMTEDLMAAIQGVTGVRSGRMFISLYFILCLVTVFVSVQASKSCGWAT